ncbi:hypothetical protein Tsubulata_021923 [Turnera subulata]|uniref:Uncharacterized protein n=1 Tax=Turnera subulata TaxID=218843 RepID=A0A9Q0F0B0_9ROSI|nr:hypothetical protein Tsubulata_021923 [Turnera subulata]
MVSSSSLSILLTPSSSFHTNASLDSSSPTTSGRLVIPFKALQEKPKPPSSLSFRFSQKSCVKFVAFSSTNSTQVAEDGSYAGQSLQNTSDFLRFVKGYDGSSGELQTSIVSYKKRFPLSLLNPFLRVDLVSTIHIADKEYFTTLQKELESYDCVLYEMVTSRKGLVKRRKLATAKRRKGSHSEGFNIIGFIQRQMARILTLDFQLDCLDYEADNWCHADLDYETFKQLQLERGESFFTLARDMTLRSSKALVEPSVPEDLSPWKSKLLLASRVLPMPLVGLFIIGSVCQVGNQASESPEIQALSRLDFGAAVKVFLAKELTSAFTEVTADVEADSVIIGERNRAACEALTRAIDEGHKRIAILYGGGHMPDLERRLQEEFNLIPTGVRWITAWTIRSRVLESNPLPFLSTLAKVSGWPLNRYQTLALAIFSLVLALDLLLWELFCDSTWNFVTDIASKFGG